MPKMDHDELRAILAAEAADALGKQMGAGTLVSDRERAMLYYLGDMKREMPTLTGRSEAVSTDVADTVEGLMPSLMDIFAACEEVVEFEPVGKEDEAAAQQETDYVNHVFMQKNPGFVILYSFLKDALLQKLGIVKVWWEEREEEQRETYRNLSDDAYAMLLDDPDIEIIEHEEREMEIIGKPNGNAANAPTDDAAEPGD